MSRTLKNEEWGLDRSAERRQAFQVRRLAHIESEVRNRVAMEVRRQTWQPRGYHSGERRKGS